MLSPSDFNNAVPQFTNGNYASNPLNPQYIAEPSSTDYNKGVEPIQTLPAQWWNWFMNKFTTRFNKVNVYVKNIFNELSQLLSVVSETPSGTEATPTIGQLKDMFETKYPDYLKTVPALSNTYVTQTTTVNGQALSGNVTVCCVACAGANGSGTAFGTAATVNIGTAAGCIPTVGTALGTTDGQFLATDANGKLKPSGYTASCFRASTWTPTCVENANKVMTNRFSDNVYRCVLFEYSGAACGQYHCIGGSALCDFSFNPTTGVLRAPYFCGQAARVDISEWVKDCNRPVLFTDAAIGGEIGRSTSLTFNPATGCLIGCSARFTSWVTTPGIYSHSDSQTTANQQYPLTLYARCTNANNNVCTAPFTFCANGIMYGTASCAGISCTFGNVVATKNQKMHTWNVYACQSGSITSVPICDIAKAICWATNNMANYSRTTISGHIGPNDVVQSILCSYSCGFCIYESNGGSSWSWTSYYYTCTAKRAIPMSISGSY